MDLITYPPRGYSLLVLVKWAADVTQAFVVDLDIRGMLHIPLILNQLHHDWWF